MGGRGANLIPSRHIGKKNKEHDKGWLIERVNKIAEESTERFKTDGKIDYYYTVYVNDWQNYGKDRTYINVYEKRTHSTHNKQINCGYYDNASGKYFPGKFDIEHGNRF